MEEIVDLFWAKSRRFLAFSFIEDLEEEKMPEKVKLSIASAGFANLETRKEEMDHTLEKERHMDILQQILPNADLRIKPKPVKEFKAIARYDPTSLTASQFETKSALKTASFEMNGKKLEKKGPLKAGVTEKHSSSLNIQKGIDKKKASDDKVDQILKKTIDIFAKSSTKTSKPSETTAKQVPKVVEKRKIVKEIKKQKWTEISQQKEELKQFKLFG